jgi:heptosyltransferase-2
VSKKILLIRFSSMGDVILITPLLSYIHTRHPDCSVSVVTYSLYASLFEDDDRVDRVYATDRKLAGLDAALRSRWDQVIDLQNSKRSRSLCRLLRPAPVFRFRKLHWRRLALLLLRVNTYRNRHGVAGRYIEAFAQAPVESDAIPPLRLGALSDPIDLPDSNRPALAIFPGAAWKNKRWPARYYAQISREFRDRGWQILIIGSDAEAALICTLAEDIGAHAYGYPGVFSLKKAAALLARCSLAAGNDTGLIHLARAAGTPTAIVYGSTTRHFGFFPYGHTPHAVLERKILCRPCHPHGGNLCLRGGRPCLTGIRPDCMIRALNSLCPNEVAGA